MICSHRLTEFLLCASMLAVTGVSQAQTIAENWHQWRGPENNGVSRTANPPIAWSEEKNIGWKAEIKGHSAASPIVWGDKVFVLTSFNTDKVDPSLRKPEDQPKRVFGITFPNTSYDMVVLCYDRKTGKQLWRDVATSLVPHEGHHRDASFSSSSPFCDGERLYCWFGSAGLFAYSLDGKKLWERDLGKAKVGASLGEGSSPVVHDGKIVLVRDHAGQSTITVLNAEDGKTLWTKDRDEKNAWATPAVVSRDGVTQVITCGSKQVRSYNLETGDLIWWANGLTGNCTPCPVVEGDTVYCMSGYEGYALLAIPLTGKGDMTESVRWKHDQGTPYVPSPILYDGKLYFTQSNQNILTCLNAKDGSVVMERSRLEGLKGIYSSPVGAAGRIYFPGRGGNTLVIKQGGELDVLAKNKLEDKFHTSPALAGNQLFLRGMRYLYCIEEGGTGGWVSEAKPEPAASPNRDLLIEIAKRPIPKDYPGGGNGHQPFVEKIIAGFNEQQNVQLGALWKEQREQFPDMKNRGNSFIRILDYVQSGPAKAKKPLPKKPKAKVTPKTGVISGLVKDGSGKLLEGVMVSAFDEEWRQSTSVFSQSDGSFRIDELRKAKFNLRARRMGLRDLWDEGVSPNGKSVELTMEPAKGEELEEQRPASEAFGMLPFDSVRDKLNFKMMCSYCHQIGTLGFRTPEEPVDWETMIKRMDGFGGLYHNTQQTIIPRIIESYSEEAVKAWPPFEPPPPPTGMAAKVKITAWEMGKPFEGAFHDLELDQDGLVYVVHIGKQYTGILDPDTGDRNYYKLPRGSYGPHSIEQVKDGSMWLTLCVSGEMARFDLKTKEYMVMSSAEPPAKRGSWPHTLRVDPKDPEGIIWYTDAGRNSVFSLHPETRAVKEYHLLEANQVKAGGKGESRGITPYGLDYSPVDGMIWYSKLNGNRIGRINPKAPDGDIVEWNPPFRGPRRLHVAPDGMVWVPGFGSGVFGKFDPKTEAWTVYPLPDYLNQIPYAVNVAPDGMVWICGTGNDTLYRFNPKTEYLIEFQLPSRVSYTREIEFDAEGNVWTSTSGPARHMENVCGQIYKLEILDKSLKEEGGVKLKPIQLSEDEQGIAPANKNLASTSVGKLLMKIEARQLPQGYSSGPHQPYVDRVLASLAPEKQARVGNLWKQKVKLDPDMENRGASFVKIMDYVAKDGGTPNPNSSQQVHRLKTERRSPFDAFVYVNRIPSAAREGESADAFAGRIHGRLANQEGRILLKLPPGMDRSAYLGFKAFIGSEGNAAVRNCIACHAPGDFAISSGGSLRDLKKSPKDFANIIRAKMKRAKAGDKGYATLNLEEADVSNLVAFLGALQSVPDERFRELILDTKVMEVTPQSKSKSKALQGQVRFEGPRPKRKGLPMDEASRKLYNTQPLDEDVLIGSEGGLANVFVYVKEGVPEGDYPPPAGPAVIDQKKSMFRPRVQGLRVGQELVMKNGDPFIHNIRSLSRKNRAFNVVQPQGTKDRKKTFSRAEGPITVKCDFHRWMTAHFFVMEHPFFAVSDEKGRFSIDGLPAGSYTLGAWHEVFGEEEIEVAVGHGSGPESVFTFRSKKD